MVHNRINGVDGSTAGLSGGKVTQETQGASMLASGSWAQGEAGWHGHKYKRE